MNIGGVEEVLLKIDNREKIANLIKENKIVILYFSNKTCGACEVIGKKVEEMLQGYPEIRSFEIEGEKHVQLAAMNDVFSFPLLILFVNGKETIRVGRNVDLMELEKSIKRYYDMLIEVNK